MIPRQDREQSRDLAGGHGFATVEGEAAELDRGRLAQGDEIHDVEERGLRGGLLRREGWWVCQDTTEEEEKGAFHRSEFAGGEDFEPGPYDCAVGLAFGSHEDFADAARTAHDFSGRAMVNFGGGMDAKVAA